MRTVEKLTIFSPCINIMKNRELLRDYCRKINQYHIQLTRCNPLHKVGYNLDVLPNPNMVKCSGNFEKFDFNVYELQGFHNIFRGFENAQASYYLVKDIRRPNTIKGVITKLENEYGNIALEIIFHIQNTKEENADILASIFEDSLQVFPMIEVINQQEHTLIKEISSIQTYLGKEKEKLRSIKNMHSSRK